MAESNVQGDIFVQYLLFVLPQVRLKHENIRYMVQNGQNTKRLMYLLDKIVWQNGK